LVVDRFDRVGNSVAVSRLKKEVRNGRGVAITLGIAEDRSVGATEVAGENEAARLVGFERRAAKFDFDEGRAENMTGVAERRADAGRDLRRRRVGNRAEKAERRVDVALRVKRAIRSVGVRFAVFLSVSLFLERDVFFLDARRVEKD